MFIIYKESNVTIEFLVGFNPDTGEPYWSTKDARVYKTQSAYDSAFKNASSHSDIPLCTFILR